MIKISSFVLRVVRHSYLQILFIFLAFSLMVIISFQFGAQRESAYLESEAQALFTGIEAQLKADLYDLETLLGFTSEAIRSMLLEGAGFEEIQRYLVSVTNYGTDVAEIRGFNSVFGYFDIFGDGYGGNLPGVIWSRDMPDYVPQERQWFIDATEANGEIIMTNPVYNLVTHEIALFYARSIYDDNGNRLAIVCLDISLARIYDFSYVYRSLGNLTWMLLDESLTIIAYPFPEFIGVPLSEAHETGISDIAERLMQDQSIVNERFLSFDGSTKIHNVRQLYNGWFLGVATPVDSYYTHVQTMFWFLGTLGFIFALGLSITMIRIHAAREKAVSEKNILTNLDNIMNGIDAMIYVTDPETGEILFINNSMKQHYEIDSDCVGSYCYKVLQEGLDEICEFCPCHKLKNDPSGIVVWEERSTKTNRTYRNTDRYIDWPDGRKVHIQHSVDMTELITARDAAEQSSRYKSDFLANMSHEIRTPMNAILGIAEIHAHDEALPLSAIKAFNRIHESGDLLLNIINDILDLSKIEAGKLELVSVQYEIASLITDTVQLNLLRFDSRSLEFVVDVDENVPYDLFGDILRIKQIINNVLSNAFKYTDTGKVEYSVFAEAETSGDDSLVTLVFRVSDTGRGMTHKQIDMLYDEYIRFKSKDKTEVAGVGLGMSITKRLVDIMGGSISVESEIDSGSVFTIRIPQKRIGTAVCGPELSNKLRNFEYYEMPITKKTQFVREYMPYGNVLVVDDVESNLYVAKGMLQPYGLAIETVTGGKQAIQKVKSGNTYDIIFMDHMMPELDGMETTKALRELGYSHTIVALTANALIGRAEMFLKNGFDGFLSKPIDSRELNYILNEFIRNKKPPEVVAAAREKMQSKSIAYDPDQKNQISDVLLRASGKDIEKALDVLEYLLPKLDDASDYELKLFTTTVHGMKSVLFNINEEELSAIAYKLEQAGSNDGVKIIQNDAPDFIQALRELIEKIKPEKKNIVISVSEDKKTVLSEKLDEVKTACENYKKRIAKNILDDIKQEEWPQETFDFLDEISTYLLHGEFKKVADAIERYYESGDII